MEDPLCIPEILGLLLSWVDDETLHSCCCVDHLWLELAAAEARQSLETYEEPTILSMNWGMLWWEDIDILLKDCAYDGIFGYKGSLEPFTCADIAQVMSVNGMWYIYSYEERAFLAIFLLKDGRFVFLFEGSETGTINSEVRIHAKCIFASSLRQLLFFGLGDANREDLGIQLDPRSPPQTKNKTDKRKLVKLHKKIKESWRRDAVNAVTFDQLEQYLTFPVARLFSHTQKLGLCMFQGPHQFRLGMAPEKRPPSMKEHTTLPANLSPRSQPRRTNPLEQGLERREEKGTPACLEGVRIRLGNVFGLPYESWLA